MHKYLTASHHIIHFSFLREKNDIQLSCQLIPLNTSPNPVSDLGDKSVNPMKRERYHASKSIFFHIAYRSLNESEWSARHDPVNTAQAIFILIQKYPSMHTNLSRFESCQRPNPNISGEFCPSYEVPLKLWGRFPSRWQTGCVTQMYHPLVYAS